MLNETLTKILKESWRVDKGKSYFLKIYNKETNRVLISLKDGNCTGTKIGSNLPLNLNDEASLEVCSVDI